MKSGVRKRGKRPTGEWRWQAYHTDPADPTKLIYYTVPRGTAQPKQAAEDWLDEQLSAIRTGRHVRPNDNRMTFAAVADEWRATWTNLGPQTRGGYESILAKHVLPVFGKRAVGDVTPAAVQDFVNRIAAHKMVNGRTRAPNTVQRIYTVLSAVLRVAVQRRYIATSPCDGVKLPRRAATGKRRERMLFLTPDEVRTLAEAMPRAQDTLAVYVAAYCGLRAGELWGLRRRDIDPLHGTLTVAQALKEIHSKALTETGDTGLIFGEPKSEAANRTLRMPAFITAMMVEHLARPVVRAAGNGPDDLVFTSVQGHPVRHGLFYKRTFQPAVKVALPHHAAYAEKRGLRWHDLRHTAVAISLSIAPNLHVVKERLGHEDIRTTINIYGHLLPSVDAALADGLDALHLAAAPVSNVVALGSVGA